MLVLTRHEGESIIVGDDIEIVILNIYGKQTRIGIDAPADIKIYREEIYRRMMEKGEIPMRYIPSVNSRLLDDIVGN